MSHTSSMPQIQMDTAAGALMFVQWLHSSASEFIRTIGVVPPTIFLFTNWPTGGDVRAQEITLAAGNPALVSPQLFHEAISQIVQVSHAIGIVLVTYGKSVDGKRDNTLVIAMEHRKLGTGPRVWEAELEGAAFGPLVENNEIKEHFQHGHLLPMVN